MSRSTMDNISGEVANRALSSVTRPRSYLREFPTHGFLVLHRDQLVEEENIPNYNYEHFYPVRLGEVFNENLQVVTKLGWGYGSTVWLARDLDVHKYVALKVYKHNCTNHRELPFYEHLNAALPSKHPGAENLRKLSQTFKIKGPHGTHVVLTHQACQMSLLSVNSVFLHDRGFNEKFVKSIIKQLLQAVDFMHTELQVVHTDIHPGNLLLGTKEEKIFRDMEKIEYQKPVSRKILDDRTIYTSRSTNLEVGPLLLSDFGEVRLGPGPHTGNIMPPTYRAPEVLLRSGWSYSVDIWSVGQSAWRLLQGTPLFSACEQDGIPSVAAHLAELIATLGPPPAEFLAKHREEASQYWDEHGNWTHNLTIPLARTPEALESKLKDATEFVAFLKRALTWDPDERPTANDLLQDPWLAESAQ